METNGIALLPDWPARSPDLNIIEHVWPYLKERVSRREVPDLDNLWHVLEDEFYKIPNSFIDNLYNSLPRRIEEVIRNHGYPTRY